MTEGDARAVLSDADGRGVPELRAVVRLLSYRGGGMFHSWNVKVDGDDTPYVTKFQSHEQPPSHRLVLELAAARLGRMFEPPVVSEHAVLDITNNHVKNQQCPAQGCGRPLSVGAAFASRQVDGGQEFRGRIPPSVPAERAASIVLFQTWLEASDAQGLFTGQGECYSMDHAAYLPGAQTWVANRAATPVVILSAGATTDGRFSSLEPFTRALDQLSALADVDIVRAFGGVPSEWFGNFEYRLSCAQYVLTRRLQVDEVVRKAFPGGKAS